MGQELVLAAELLDHLRQRLLDAERPVARLSLAPGGSAVAFDDCCDGQAWVRLVRSVPTYDFPAAATAVRGGCPPLEHAVTYEIGVLRCASTLDNDGRPPTVEQINDDTARQLQDLDVMRLVATAFGRTRPAYLIGEYTPIDVAGGCVGGLLTVQVVA